MSKADTSDCEVWTIVVAAGSANRFGGAKLSRMLGSRSILDWSLGVASSASDGVVLVLGKDQKYDGDVKVDLTVTGGATRTESVRAGLAAVPVSAAVVCVHDAARPFATEQLFANVIASVKSGADAAVPGLALVDTVKLLATEADRVVERTLDRSRLVAVQTPQAFDARALRAAHKAAGEGTDDASLVEQMGGKVVVVVGEAKNTKVTVQEDLATMNRSLNAGSTKLRIGHGYDIHRFSEDCSRKMLLGGIYFPEVHGLVGHSDADVVCHAVIDALLSATGHGDIGQRFPDTDEQFAGADSVEMLREVSSLLSDGGWVVHNVDCTVVAEEPKLAPRRQEMQDLLTDVVGGQVSVKGKRAEGLGAIGRAEGVACWAVALVAQETPE